MPRKQKKPTQLFYSAGNKYEKLRVSDEETASATSDNDMEKPKHPEEDEDEARAPRSRSAAHTPELERVDDIVKRIMLGNAVKEEGASGDQKIEVPDEWKAAAKASWREPIMFEESAFGPRDSFVPGSGKDMTVEEEYANILGAQLLVLDEERRHLTLDPVFHPQTGNPWPKWYPADPLLLPVLGCQREEASDDWYITRYPDIAERMQLYAKLNPGLTQGVNYEQLLQVR